MIVELSNNSVKKTLGIFFLLCLSLVNCQNVPKQGLNGCVLPTRKNAISNIGVVRGIAASFHSLAYGDLNTESLLDEMINQEINDLKIEYLACVKRFDL